MFETIIGFDNYEINRKGTIRRKKGAFGRNYDYHYFKPRADKDGYLEVGIRDSNGKRFFRRVHRLVALNFVDNPDNLPVVNHKDGVKDNNSADNLEWCTISYNTQHGFDILGRVGNNGGMNKPVQKLDKNTLEILETYDSLKEASKSVGVLQSGLTSYFERVSRGVNATCGGFKWRLIEEDVTTNESTSRDGSE